MTSGLDIYRSANRRKQPGEDALIEAPCGRMPFSIGYRENKVL